MSILVPESQAILVATESCILSEVEKGGTCLHVLFSLPAIGHSFKYHLTKSNE